VEESIVLQDAEVFERELCLMVLYTTLRTSVHL